MSRRRSHTATDNNHNCVACCKALNAYSPLCLARNKIRLNLHLIEPASVWFR